MHIHTPTCLCVCKHGAHANMCKEPLIVQIQRTFNIASMSWSWLAMQHPAVNSFYMSHSEKVLHWAWAHPTLDAYYNCVEYKSDVNTHMQHPFVLMIVVWNDHLPLLPTKKADSLWRVSVDAHLSFSKATSFWPSQLPIDGLVAWTTFKPGKRCRKTRHLGSADEQARLFEQT